MSRHNLSTPLMMALFLVIAPPTVAQDRYLAADIKPPLTSKNANITEVNDSYQADLMYAGSRYRIGANDSISLRFPYAPEFNQTVRVEADGLAALAGVGALRIEGLTTPELAGAIQLAYSKILRDSTVIVELKDFVRPYFLILGDVNRPGKYDLRGYTSATEALAVAGGLKDTAQYSQVLLFRHATHDWYEVKSLDLKQLLRGRDLEGDAEVRPGDMLFVSQKRLLHFKRFVP